MPLSAQQPASFRHMLDAAPSAFMRVEQFATGPDHICTDMTAPRYEAPIMSTAFAEERRAPSCAADKAFHRPPSNLTGKSVALFNATAKQYTISVPACHMLESFS